MVKFSTSIYAYPWDLLDEGLDQALDTIAALGVDALHVSMAYHSGKFLSPRNPRRRIYFPEGGVVYFRPTPVQNLETPIRPVISELTDQQEFVSALSRECRDRGLKPVAWVIGMHNTRLGQRHPEFTVKNVYGDSYPYALCPSHRATRNYVKLIVENLLRTEAFDAIEVESIGYLGFLHGYHHEFYGVSLGPFEQSLLALCFCSSCESLATKAGVEMSSLRALVSKTLDHRLNQPIDREESLAESMSELADFVSSNEALRLLIQERCDLVTGFIAELAEIVHNRGGKLYCDGPVFIQPAALGWVEGLEATKIDRVIDRFEVAVPSEGTAACAGLDCPVGACINVGHPHTRDYAGLQSATKTAAACGFRNIGFYNYGMLPEYRLRWIKEAIESAREEAA